MGKGEKIKITLNLPACKIPPNLMLFNTLVCTVLYLLLKKKLERLENLPRSTKMEKLKLKAVLLKLMALFLCIQLDRCSVGLFKFFNKKSVIFFL